MGLFSWACNATCCVACAWKSLTVSHRKKNVAVQQNLLRDKIEWIYFVQQHFLSLRLFLKNHWLSKKTIGIFCCSNEYQKPFCMFFAAYFLVTAIKTKALPICVHSVSIFTRSQSDKLESDFVHHDALLEKFYDKLRRLLCCLKPRTYLARLFHCRFINVFIFVSQKQCEYYFGY